MMSLLNRLIHIPDVEEMIFIFFYDSFFLSLFLVYISVKKLNKSDLYINSITENIEEIL